LPNEPLLAVPHGLGRAIAAALVILVLAMPLSGCSTLGFGNKDGEAAAQGPGLYEVTVDAPDPLRAILEAHLDLNRYRHAPATEGITDPELGRLVAAAPEQVRTLLETEGYYDPEVRVTREAPADRLPQVRIHVVPGPRTVVDGVELEVAGDLQTAAAAGDVAAADTLDAFRQRWALKRGQPLRAEAWTDAKKATLQQLRSAGYAAAAWKSTEARIDADAHRAELQLVAESGPRFRLGPVSVDGLQRYDADGVLRLAGFTAGQPYTEQVLRDYQERLQKANLFESVVVEIDPALETHDAAPVRVRVKEQRVQQATVGIGYSANTGPRVTLEHTHRSAFGAHWLTTNKIELGPSLKSWTGELTSRPLDNLYRNVMSGNYERLRSGRRVAHHVDRACRPHAGHEAHRALVLRGAHALAPGHRPRGTEDNDAASLNYHWTWRGVDNVLVPTDGTTLALEGAGGYATDTIWPMQASFRAAARSRARWRGSPGTVRFRATTARRSAGTSPRVSKRARCSRRRT
jgi:translocation and assembly module TamA